MNNWIIHMDYTLVQIFFDLRNRNLTWETWRGVARPRRSRGSVSSASSSGCLLSSAISSAGVVQGLNGRCLIAKYSGLPKSVSALYIDPKNIVPNASTNMPATTPTKVRFWNVQSESPA